MKTIICPHCKKEFSIEKNDYDEIVKQLLEKELKERISQKETELLKDKKYELENLRQQYASDIARKEKDSDLQIEKLKSQIATIEQTKKAEIEKEVKNKELELKDSIEKEKRKTQEKENEVKNLQEEIIRLQKGYEEKLNQKQIEKDNAINIAEAKIKESFNQTINNKNIEIQELKGQVNNFQAEKKNAILEASAKKDNEIRDKEKTIAKLQKDLDYKEKEKENQKLQMQNMYEQQLKMKDDQILYYKDMKAKMSTKMIGESLEEHCRLEFEKIRQTGFQKAYFEKDNDIKNDTKGDFIFRDYDDNGEELVSIMFEMKNETDNAVAKHKNEEFFKKLDKDRKDKKCEYAVLVSLLEQDNELYNAGIVDVSHKYEKMYVIRPQFFIPIITLIRNASTKALEYKNELALVRNQNIDITNFERDMNDFKEKFSKNVSYAETHFNKAIEEIDKTIDHLQKTKEGLLSTIRQLGNANDKAEKLTIRSLTKNNPTMQLAFERLNKDK